MYKEWKITCDGDIFYVSSSLEKCYFNSLYFNFFMKVQHIFPYFCGPFIPSFLITILNYKKIDKTYWNKSVPITEKSKYKIHNLINTKIPTI